MILTPKSLKLLFIMLICLNSIMALIAFFMYPPLKFMPYSFYYLLFLEIILFIYLLIVLRLFNGKQLTNLKIINIGLTFGIIEAIIEILHIATENYCHLPGHFESIFTGIVMLVLLVLFLFSGYVAGKATGDLKFTLLSGAWNTIVCMLLVSTFGLSQLFWDYSAIKHHDIGSPDYFRTGWTDFDAFVIADILMACIKILFVWPFIGAILGLAGGSIAIYRLKGIKMFNHTENILF